MPGSGQSNPALRHQQRTILAQFILRIMAPSAAVVVSLVVLSYVLNQQAFADLVAARNLQLALVAAERIEAVLDTRAQALLTLAANRDAWTIGEARRVLQDAADVLTDFDGGVIILDTNGSARAKVGNPGVTATMIETDVLSRVRNSRQAVYSDLLVHAETGLNMVAIAAPLEDNQQNYLGALVGTVYLTNTALSEPVRQFRVGQFGFAYAVDSRGRILFTPDTATIGTDYSSVPHVREVMRGKSGGTVTTAIDGTRIVVGYVPIRDASWGLIVREPWSDVVAPAMRYGWLTLGSGVLILLASLIFLWRGVRAIEGPMRHLANNAERLARDETAQPVEVTGIVELDALSKSMAHMVQKITQYRAGLRRYVGAVTRSQEDERRKIARELHDETAQNLLAMSRQVELYQQREHDPRKAEQLRDLQRTLNQTLLGVRQISRDLRPPALEDLGLVPALRGLVNDLRTGVNAVPRATLEVTGDEVALSAEQELVIYRITQEALTNVRRHARANTVHVQLHRTPDKTILLIQDDGSGFVAPANPAELAQTDHFGLIGIQERVWSVAGTWRIEGALGRGTKLSVEIPVHGAANGHSPAAT